MVEPSTSPRPIEDPNTFDDLEYPEAYTPEPPSPRRDWIHQIHLFLDVPKSSTPALVYAVVMLFIILASTTAFLVSSLPKYYNRSVFTGLQIAAGSIFTVDYILRLLTSDHWYKWMLRPLSLIDLLVVVPFLVSLVPSITLNQQFLALRAVRLLYILKIIKITSYVRMTRVVARTFKKSKDGFVVLLVGVLVMCLFYSTLVFIAENSAEHFDDKSKQWIRDDGTPGEFQSIFDGIWWCLVTFTTVGYGDIYPITTFGKVVGVFTMFTGVLLTALPIAIFTANFTELWKERKYQRRAEFIKKLAVPEVRIMTQKQKDEEIADLLQAIEKEERHIAAAVQSAWESVHDAHNSHKHMQVLLAQLRKRVNTRSFPEDGSVDYKVYEQETDSTRQETKEEEDEVEEGGDERPLESEHHQHVELDELQVGEPQ